MLFTRVPIRKTVSLLGRHFEEDILIFFRHVLTSSYVSFAVHFYEKIDSVAMVLQLSPVITNFYMEDFKEMALDRAPHKPLCWFRYVDDTFVFWPHGLDRLRDFLGLLNSVHRSIQFTMETFPFWISIFTGDPVVLWAIECTVNLPIPTST
jgi:hypothetical protein